MVRAFAYRDFMLEDYYLIHFLRAQRLHLERTKGMFEKTMKWRKANSIDNITENVHMKTWMMSDYPFSNDGIDRTGSPVLTLSAGDWDIRSAVLGGKISKLHQFTAFVYESTTAKIRSYRNDTLDVTQYIHIYDVKDFSAKHHGCLACMGYYNYLIQQYELYYPDNAKHIIILNTPVIFRGVLELLRPLMSTATRKSLRVFSHDKAEWGKALNEVIAPDQLTPQYGGTRQITKS